MCNANQLAPSVLMQFTGSENWYRHGLVSNALFTDGEKHVAYAGGASETRTQAQAGGALIIRHPFPCRPALAPAMRPNTDPDIRPAPPR
jgi:hypothetical protein